MDLDEEDIVEIPSPNPKASKRPRKKADDNEFTLPSEVVDEDSPHEDEVDDDDDDDEIVEIARPAKRRRKTKARAEDEDGLPTTNGHSVPHSREIHSHKTILPLLPQLLEWFDKVKDSRGMPWRKLYDSTLSRDEKAQRAYEVLVSEIMLQQTQVSTNLLSCICF